MSEDLDVLKKLETGENIPTRTIINKPNNIFQLIPALFRHNESNSLPTNYVETEEEARMTGWERIKTGLSQFKNGEDNFEISIIMNSISMGGLAGFVYSIIHKHKESVEEFTRKHNTNIFKNKFEANRKLVDFMYLNMFRNGLKLGVRFAAFSGLFMSAITFTAVYDNGFRYHHSALAGGLATAIWKLSLGPRAMAVSSVLGAIMGLTYAGTINLYLNLTGTTLSGYRHIYRIGTVEG